MDEFKHAHRHRNFDPKLLEKVKKQPKELVRRKATPESRKLYSMSRQAGMCSHKWQSFARLKVSRHGILYAEIEPEHSVEDMVVAVFVNRFPLFVVVIGSSRGVWLGFKEEFRGKVRIVKIKNKTQDNKNKDKKTNKEIEEVVANLERELPVNPLLRDLSDFDDNIYRTFYDSQYIPERRNHTYFFRMMPKKYLNSVGMEFEKRSFFGVRTLDMF